VGGEYFEFFATMIAVQHRIGGSLSALLLDLANSLQAQQEFALNVRALTAQARYSGLVVTALPFVVLGVIVLVTPQYVAPLVETTTGRVLVGIALALVTVGQIVIRRISQVEI
jgi:Flp pilus assembly protein TadB